MFELYFKNPVTLLSTIWILSVIVFIVMTFIKKKSIDRWGRKILILGLAGLLVCILVASRDNYHLSVQASWDNSIHGGIFAINSIQSLMCSIGGGVIAFASLSTIFIKNQKYKKTIFYILAVVFICKMLVIEVSRILLL